MTLDEYRAIQLRKTEAYLALSRLLDLSTMVLVDAYVTARDVDDRAFMKLSSDDRMEQLRAEREETDRLLARVA